MNHKLYLRQDLFDKIVYLKTSINSENWYLFGFTNEGTIRLVYGVPDNIGLPTDNHGKVKIE
jgi:hypothetical protein